MLRGEGMGGTGRPGVDPATVDLVNSIPVVLQTVIVAQASSGRLCQLVTAFGVALALMNGAMAQDRRALDGLRACGTGGFALPGSSTCIRLAGSVTTETSLHVGGGRARSASPSLFTNRVQGRVAADIRMPTTLGPLRVYTSVRAVGSGGAGHP